MRIAVIAGVIVVVVVGAFLGYTLLGNSETKITLSGNPCTLTKEDPVNVKKGKKITWEIDNQCASAQTVRIGNFRAAATGGPNDCSVEGSDWPFGKAEDKPLPARERTVNSGESKKIKQRTAINNTGSPLTFYFDVCLGGARVDPRLIVDPY